MPNFSYRGRDKEGQLRSGQRVSISMDTLNDELSKEGITVIEIQLLKSKYTLWQRIQDRMQSNSVHLAELAIFARQMQLLYNANVPMIASLKQLANYTRSHRLAIAIDGIMENIQRGQNLANSMQQYPDVFSPLIINIIRIGESSGHLGDAFGNIFQYIEFELATIKQLKAAFRYPLFACIAIGIAIAILNLFVIPTFARFYVQLGVALPWQTRILIASSNFFVHDGLYVLIAACIGIYFFRRYLHTVSGRYTWDRWLLRMPLIGKLVRKILIIRFCQAMYIILEAGVSLTEGLGLVRNVMNNAYLSAQIKKMQENIERGMPFTQAVTQTNLFNILELEILAVGEKNGELGPGLKYISTFNNQEIEFDLKKLNDVIGPVMIAGVSILVLIMALGVYLPVWNMVNLAHAP